MRRFHVWAAIASHARIVDAMPDSPLGEFEIKELKMAKVQRFAAVAVFATVAVLSVPAHFVAHAQGTGDPAAGWSINEGAGTSIGDSFGSQTGIVDGATWTAGKNTARP